MSIDESHAPPVDRRRLRANRSRTRIVEAILALVREGMLSPSAEAVATRAGVGLRTVFRLFSDMESLHREMHERVLAEIAPMLSEPLTATDVRGRLEQLIDRRSRLFEDILPLKMAGDLRRDFSPYLQQAQGLLLTRQREMLRDALSPAGAIDPLTLEALDVALSIEAWGRLRRDQRLSPADARAVMRHLVERLLPG